MMIIKHVDAKALILSKKMQINFLDVNFLLWENTCDLINSKIVTDRVEMTILESLQ